MLYLSYHLFSIGRYGVDRNHVFVGCYFISKYKTIQFLRLLLYKINNEREHERLISVAQRRSFEQTNERHW